MGQAKFDIHWLNSKTAWSIMDEVTPMHPMSKKTQWKWKKRIAAYLLYNFDDIQRRGND